MNKRVVLTILILVSLIPTVPVKAEPFTYFEYPTETWIIEKQDYFGQFLEWNFIPIEGQHGDKRAWNFTWTKREYLEIYNDTTGDIVAFYENPIPSIKQNLNDTDFLMDKYEELKDLGGFTNQGDFVSDCWRLDKYPIVPEDKEDFTGLHTNIDILNHDQGWFLVSFKDKWKLGKKITIGFGSTITYNGGTNTITVTGGTEGSEIDFWDLWNASSVNGWDVVNNTCNTQYKFWSILQVGDGSTPTWFADTEKQIVFADGLVGDWGDIMIFKRYSHFRLGVLEDATQKRTSRGCSFISLEASNPHEIYGDNSYRTDIEIEFYSTQFSSVGKLHLIRGQYRTKVYNCILTSNVGFHQCEELDIFNTVIQNITAWRGPFEAQTNPTIDKLTVTDMLDYYGVYFHYTTGSATLNNLYSRNCRYVVFSNGASNNDYLINPDVDSWAFRWLGVCTNEVFRQYNFNVVVVDNLGIPIYNADIALTYSGQGGGSVGTWETPVNGSIPEQTISKGFYNQTGGDTIYPYEPYNLTVSAPGYDTESFTFNISEPTSWTIGLMESVTEVEITVGMELMLFAGLAALATLGAFITTASIGVVAGGLGAMLWFFTAQWFIVERAGEATAVFSNVFLLLAALCVFLTLKNALGVYNEATSKGGYE